MSTGYDIRKYMQDKGYTERKALNDRQTHAQEWLAWCSERGITPDAEDPRGANISRAMKKRAEKIRAKKEKQDMNDTEDDNMTMTEAVDTVMSTEDNGATTTADRYRAVEDTAFRQLRLTQGMLDNALAEVDIQDTMTLARAVSEVMRSYDAATKSRVAYDMLQGRYIPASIVDTYKQTFYPLITQSVDNMRLQLLALLPDEYKAVVQAAWQTAYAVYADGVSRAEAALNSMTDEARAIAEKELTKSKSKIQKG